MTQIMHRIWALINTGHSTAVVVSMTSSTILSGTAATMTCTVVSAIAPSLTDLESCIWKKGGGSLATTGTFRYNESVVFVLFSDIQRFLERSL